MAGKIVAVTLCLLAACTWAQKAGTMTEEEHPKFNIYDCSAGGCTKEEKSLVIDANWRWIHDGQGTNCYKGTEWDSTLCPDPETCTSNCHVDGVSVAKYEETYGVTSDGDTLNLGFVTEHQYGSNFGSRMYVMDGEDKYMMFKLKNREFTFDVDVSKMPCGLNGALYFVEMPEDGGLSSTNEAGAKYGTGYCDAQCPHDMKFIKGQANVKNWDSEADPPVGHYGICCYEMDIWEANSRATAYTPHTCSIEGSLACEGKLCGDNEKDQRYEGVCDKDGCDFNSWRMGDKEFFGRSGRSKFEINSKKKMTVVTQFITSDGTDSGDLVDIKRFYIQDGKVVPNSESNIKGVTGNSITQEFCENMKKAFDDTDHFTQLGGMKAMGESLDRGMVLVMSLWDDSKADMLWLDSSYPLDRDAEAPGVNRGPCKTTTGKKSYVRAKYPHSAVAFSKVKFGAINSTFNTGSTSGGQGGSGGDPFDDDRRLDETQYV